MTSADAIAIRSAEPGDADALWTIIRSVTVPAETWALDPGMTREQALAFWSAPGMRSYVAVDGDRVAGTYFLRPNHQGPGSHVANAGYMVALEARGRGIGERMGRHSLEEARRLGFRALQFNFVVSTNTAAVALWQRLGFRIVGTLPGAFRHPRFGFVDVYVMFQSLVPPETQGGSA